MSQRTFACHQVGAAKPAVCAGFMLRAHHNLALRMGYSTGRFGMDVTDAGVELHEDYRAMAIANGVEPDDPVIAPCR